MFLKPVSLIAYVAEGDSWLKSSFNSSAFNLMVISLLLERWLGLNFEIGISLKMDYSSTPSRRGESFPPSPILGIDDTGY
jgi:hypothetical protein